MPGNKALHAHLLGLSAGFLLVTLNLFYDLSAFSWVTVVWLSLWFVLTTYYSGWFFIITLIAFVLLKLTSLGGSSPAYVVMNFCHWYFLGYLTGAAFTILYNDFVYLFTLLFEGDKIKIAFAYNPRYKINIIKSPKSTEEHAMNELFARKPHLKDRRLYQYKFAIPPFDPSRPHHSEVPPHPYTIVFVANPYIRKRIDSDNTDEYEVDPIIRNRDLFLRAVDRALFNLELDPVIGRPEIWSRIRVVTIFNKALAREAEDSVAMVEEFQEELEDDRGRSIDNNLLDPMASMHANFGTILRLSRGREPHVLEEDDVDVIFAFTGSRTHDRSASHPSDWTEALDASGLRNLAGEREGVPFTFDVDPADNKPPMPGETIYPTLHPHNDADPAHVFRTVHDFCALHAGRIALNVVGARDKTFAHEFAHAMSSAMHGAITDEYVDYFVLANTNSTTPIDQTPIFFVNRIDRNFSRMISAQPLPVPKIFADYNLTRYDADLDHPSAEEGWAGYFPDKFADTIPCTMDRDYGGHRFDELLSAFIYDRMMAKVTRPQKCQRPAAVRGAEREHVPAEIISDEERR